MSLARLTVDLTCTCRTKTSGYIVLLKREGTSPVVCPHCGATFDITFLKNAPPTLVVDPADEKDPVRVAKPPKGDPS